MLLLSFLWHFAAAETLAGVTLPDEITLGGERLLLNGMGVREKYWLDIYAAGLYVPFYTDDPDVVIYENIPKRIHSTFIYPKVTREQLQESLQENMKDNPDISKETKMQLLLCFDWMEDLSTGDDIIFDYVPEMGTTIYVKGREKGTIPGEAFGQAIFHIYLGPSVSYPPLKKSLLGGNE